MKYVTKHTLSAAIVIVFGVLAVASTSKDKKDEGSSKAEEKKTEEKSGDKKADEKKAAPAKKIGELVSFDDSEWTVIEVKDLGTTAPSNNQFEKAGSRTMENSFG